MKPRKKILFIIGPTATGKTEVGVQVARHVGGEIISCDSMQIYKGMDIITSKPPLKLRRKVRHHLLNFVSPQDPFDVSQYRQRAVLKIEEIMKRGKIPVFVGGTGLYMLIVIEGIFEDVPQDPNIRAGLYEQVKLHGSHLLHTKLKNVDAESAAKIHPRDTKRIVRALEVFLATGQPISMLQRQRQGLSKKYELRMFGLNMPRPQLYRKIDNRVEQMFEQGLVQEVKKLLRRRLSRTAGFAIGIKELKGYFDCKYDLEEAKRLIKRNTRLYAKRQLTWFRKDKRIQWFCIAEHDNPQDIADKIICQLKKPS